jgi:hypothetical protein
MDSFTNQSPEDLNIPNVPEGYSFLVRTKEDTTFARELLCVYHIILRFVAFKIGPGESVDGDHLFKQLWKLANDRLLVPVFYSRGAASSGLSKERTRSLIAKNPVFRSFINEIIPHLMFVVYGCSRMKAEPPLAPG